MGVDDRITVVVKNRKLTSHYEQAATTINIDDYNSSPARYQ